MNMNMNFHFEQLKILFLTHQYFRQTELSCFPQIARRKYNPQQQYVKVKVIKCGPQLGQNNCIYKVYAIY